MGTGYETTLQNGTGPGPGSERNNANPGFTADAAHQFASAREFQPVAGASAVTINDGVAMAVHDPAGGTTFVFDTSLQAGVSLVLEKGYNPIEVTNVVSTTATVTLLAW